MNKQHPCRDKCSQFKEEQCHTCLINEETLADFIAGDVVVLKDLNLLCVEDLITLSRFDGEFWETDHRIGRVTERAIRSASVSELDAKTRLKGADDA